MAAELHLMWLLTSFYVKPWASLVVQIVKNLPAVWETRVQSLGWEDPLEKEMAAHSTIHAQRIPWTEEPGRLQSMGSQRVGHNWVINTMRTLQKIAACILLATSIYKVDLET